LEYGKSYEGYWDGTKFMAQVRHHFIHSITLNNRYYFQLKNKTIPAFEAAHGPGTKCSLWLTTPKDIACIDWMLCLSAV
jgi:hypothetical protein